MFKFEMKARVVDTLTNYSGTITARAEFNEHPNKYLVEAIDSTGRPIEWWVDENRLVDLHDFED